MNNIKSAQTFKLKKDLVIIDVETTGTNPETGSIIQLGAWIFSKYGYLTEFKTSLYIKPYTREWTQGAFEVHKLEKSFLKEAGKKLDHALYLFERWIENCYPNQIHPFRQVQIAQWSCGWDVRYLEKAYKKAKRKYPFGYSQLDIKSIVTFQLALEGKLPKKRNKCCGEKYCAKKLNIIVEASQLHNALYDARLSGLLLEKIIENHE